MITRFWFSIQRSILLSALFLAASLHLSNAATVTVTVAPGGLLRYSPTNVTINLGDTVVFSDPSGGHTVTGTGSDPFCGGGNVFPSCQVTFNTIGTFPYQCSVPGHAQAGMVGSVIVQSSAVPTISGSGGTLAYPIGGPPQTIDGAITVTDSGSTTLASATVSISSGYNGLADTLSFTAVSGISGTFNSGILSLSGSSSLANYQAVLRSVSFSTTDSSATTRTISFVVNDGNASSAAYSRSVSLQVTDSPPTLTGSSGAASYTEGGSPVNVDSLVTVSDTDSPFMGGASVTIAIGFATGQDLLSFTPVGSISGSYNATTGVLTLSGADSQANYTTALRSVKYSNSSQNPSTTNRSIRFLVNDGQASSQPFSRSLTVTAIDNPPVVSGAGGNTSYTAPGPAITLDGSVTVSDADNGTLQGATISIFGNFQPHGDVLGFTNQNGIAGSFDTDSGVLTLTGNAIVQNYQVALRSITFGNTSSVPSGLQRTMTFTAFDGQKTSAPYFRVVNVKAPPTVSLTSPSNNVTNNAPASVSLAATAFADTNNLANNSVTKVEFFDEGVLIGTATQSPYGVTLSGLNGGVYLFTAKATDLAGLSATTPPVTNFVRGAVITPVRLADGTFQFTLNSLNTSKTNQIEYSSDLKLWLFLTNFVPSASSVTFTDTNAVNQPQRYYRHSVFP